MGSDVSKGYKSISIYLVFLPGFSMEMFHCGLIDLFYASFMKLWTARVSVFESWKTTCERF